jgi:steroid delta-isomerase-like uncharacterized protein
MDLAQFVITSAIAVIGVYLAHSFSRQQRIKIAEQRVDGYRKLWGQMFVARPTRVEPPENMAPLAPDEAARLHMKLTKWYFEGGNGMLLPHDTREMYLAVKRRMGRYASESKGGDWHEAGDRVMRDLSLLRSQMKSDLQIYGVFYFDSLNDGDRELIRTSGLDPERWGRPWYRWATSPRYWSTRVREDVGSLRTARGPKEAQMDHAATVRQMYDLLSAGDVDGFGELLADDFVEHEESPGLAPTKDGVKEFFRMYRTAFPDLRMEPLDVLTSGDKVVARARATGTHQGDFMGMRATGKSVDVQLIDILRFGDDGFVHEHWGVFDALMMMQQLGAIPAGAPA